MAEAPCWWLFRPGKQHGLPAKLKAQRWARPESQGLLIEPYFITWFGKARNFRWTPHQADIVEDGLCLAAHESWLGLHTRHCNGALHGAQGQPVPGQEGVSPAHC